LLLIFLNKAKDEATLEFPEGVQIKKKTKKKTINIIAEEYPLLVCNETLKI